MAFSSYWGGLSTGGRGGSVGARDPEGRTMDVRRVQGIVYTRNNTEDAIQVSRKLAKEGMGSLRQPGQDTVWGKPQR